MNAGLVEAAQRLDEPGTLSMSAFGEKLPLGSRFTCQC